MLLPLVLATAALSGPTASTSPTQAPVAARCAYGLGVVVQPPGLIGVFKYIVDSGLRLRQSTQLASANLRSGAVGAACERVRAVTPPAHPRGLAGPWSRRVESRVYCGEGGTVQIRSIVSKGRIVGTRLLMLRKDVAATTKNHYLDGRHVIVDVQLRAKGGGVWFDPTYCDRSSIQ